jgi:hypothetical protein
MLQFGSSALLALAFAITLELRVADAAAVSGDLSLPEFCAGCAPLPDEALKTQIFLSMDINETIQSSSSCKYYDETDCGSIGQIFSIETTTEIVKSIDDHFGSEILEYQSEHQGNSGCGYFESKLRDQSRVQAECDNIEPASGHGDLVGVVTLTTVSVGAFALLAGVLLLHRLFRNWRLQSLIQRDKSSSSLQIHNSRR